jgi:phage terminase Nu1 subunit (DNA packaging protein)
MTALTQEQAAIVANLTTRRLRQLDETGEGPPRDRAGGYPAKAFSKWLAKRIASALGVASDGKRYDLSAERARHSKELADARALQNRHASGEFFSKKALDERLAAMFMTFRTRALGLPSKLAPLLAKQPANFIAAELDREMRELLQEFAGWRFDRKGDSNEA